MITRTAGKRFLLAMSVISLFLLNAAPARALLPPSPDEVARLKASGQWEERLKKAEAAGSQRIDPSLLKGAVARARRSALFAKGYSKAMVDGIAPAPPSGWKGMPTKGNVKTFALLIDFADYRSSNSREFIHEQLYGAGDASRFPVDSLANFYDRSSYGQLSLHGGTTLGWYHAPYSRAEVQQTDAGREALVREALAYFDAQGHDFSQYDNDGDGVIDYFLVIWAGPDSGWNGFWWSLKTNFNDQGYTIDGKKLGAYSWNFQRHPLSSAQSFDVITMIHETGHALGIPDYYDMDPEKGPKGALGGLDMMDANWGDHSAFSKWVLDWITPTVVSGGSQTLTLNPSGTSKDAVLMMPDITGADPFGEFFIVQNRNRVGNDYIPRSDLHPYGPLPGDGLLIWHVDARLNAAGNDFLYNNSFTDHKLLRLMEADGLEEIERSVLSTTAGAANAGDYYVPGKSLGPETTPSSASYEGGYTGVSVGGIATSGQQISATFSILPNARLAVTKSGSGLGTVSSAEVGINCGADCSQDYKPGSSVTLTAEAGPLSSFTGWSGACSGTGSCSVTMNRDTAVSANFALITGGSGNILVNSGFEQGKEPWGEVSSGGYDIVTNEPGLGNGNSDWYAALGGYDGAVELLSQDVTIPAQATAASLSFRYKIATEELDPVIYDSLSILVTDPADNGKTLLAMLGKLSNVDRVDNWTQSGPFDLSAFRGQKVRLAFLATNDGLNATLFRLDDIALNVTLGAPASRTLTVTLAGNGTGAVNSVTAGSSFSCAAGSCSASLPDQNSITLSAAASAGSSFSGWSGACSGTGTCGLSMDADKEVTATFETLSLLRTGGASFGTLQAGYNAALNGASIQARAALFQENLVADREVSVRLQGGFDSGYLASTGFSILSGRLGISRGTLRVQGIKLR